jgi:hypothetical protein
VVTIDRVLQEIRGVFHPVDVGGVVVETYVPLTSPERLQVTVPISNQLLQLGEQFRVASSPIEKGDLVSPVYGILNGVGPDKPCSAQDQNLQLLIRAAGLRILARTRDQTQT